MDRAATSSKTLDLQVFPGFLFQRYWPHIVSKQIFVVMFSFECADSTAAASTATRKLCRFSRLLRIDACNICKKQEQMTTIDTLLRSQS